MKKKKKKGIFSKIFEVFTTIILIGLTTASICAVVFAMYINDYIVPKSDIDISGLNLNLTSKIYYKDPETGADVELEKLHGEQNRIFAPIEEIPDDLQKAFISIEDERFYTHDGVDWKRTVLAAVNWVIPIQSEFGGSTITQQLVKNITEDDDYSVTRKITEILRALNLDKELEKDDILELYLNTIYLGRNAYGVKTAAITYFDKDLSELNLAENALLAGITKNPSYYDPFTYPENIKERQEIILNQMYLLGYITEAEKNEAIAYELVYAKTEYDEQLQTSQSYFTDAVIEDVLADLMEQKGYSLQIAEQLLFSGGLEIYTTLDPRVQDIMETAFENDANFPDITGKDGERPEAAMVIMDPTTGAVKGVVGGRGEKVGDRIQNKATQTLRQPGSALKPITAYAPGFDYGLISPISVLDDTPYNFIQYGGWPRNSYSGFRGRMDIMEAVEDSSNTIAVKVVDMLSAEVSFNFAKTNLGLYSLIESKEYSTGTASDMALAPLALGGLTEGVTVLEMTAAYVPFANDGTYYEPYTYTKVLGPDGAVILENTGEGQAAFQRESTVHYMRQVLENVVAAGTGYGAKVPYMDTLGKTGTTDDNHDRWFAGSTPYYTAAVWFGYEYPQVIRVSGTNPAQALWHDVMVPLHEGLEPKAFPQEEGLVSASFCLDSGMAPSEYCSQDMRGSRVSSGRVAPEDAPTEVCTWHREVPIDITTGGIATSACPIDKVENRVLVDYSRVFEQSIYVADEQFMVHYDNDAVGNGTSYAFRTSSGQATTYTGYSCLEHPNGHILWPDQVPMPEIDPETGEEIDPSDEGNDSIAPFPYEGQDEDSNENSSNNENSSDTTSDNSENTTNNSGNEDLTDPENA